MDLSVVGTNLAEVIKWVGSVITALTSETGELAALADLLMISVSISALLLGELLPLHAAKRVEKSSNSVDLLFLRQYRAKPIIGKV